jgi:hypothetical protein
MVSGVRNEKLNLASILISLFLSLGFTFGCGPDGSRHHFKTDFGNSGNQDLRSRFERYVVQHQTGCLADSMEHRRVIVTGFGMFSGVESNISGSIVASMANQHLTPPALDLQSSSFSKLLGPPDVGRI